MIHVLLRLQLDVILCGLVAFCYTERTNELLSKCSHAYSLQAHFAKACEQALLFGRVKRVSRERASERRSREGQGKENLQRSPTDDDRIVSHDAFFQKHHAISQSWQIPSRNKGSFLVGFFLIRFPVKVRKLHYFVI